LGVNIYRSLNVPRTNNGEYYGELTFYLISSSAIYVSIYRHEPIVGYLAGVDVEVKREMQQQQRMQANDTRK